MVRFLKYILIIYQRFLSPLKPPKCRFMPSCSSYAIQAIDRYGAIKGIMLTIFRIIRCNPFFKGGYDPLK